MKDLTNIYDDLNWDNANDYSDETKIKVLRDEDKKGRTILLKLPKGFSMGPHSHITTEQHIVIEGEYQIEEKNYPAGSYQIFKPGVEHGPFKSKYGALILVIWDPILE